jgi:hypothetical protein
MSNTPKENKIDESDENHYAVDTFPFWVEDDKTYLEEWEETRKYFD